MQIAHDSEVILKITAIHTKSSWQSLSIINPLNT